MPNTLIVHLQRIIFCFDTLQNDKVNSRFEFPHILDLKPYSYKEVMKGAFDDVEEPGSPNVEDLKLERTESELLTQVNDDDYIYRLVGVNVHVGTADHGHYYSLINTKRGQDEPRG